MTVEHVRDDLGLYALGLLEAHERAAVERHLATCEECRGELLAHDRTLATLAGAVTERSGRSLREDIVRRHRPWLGRLRLPRVVLAPVIATAALALLAAGAGAEMVPLEATDGTGGRGVVVVLERQGAAMILLALAEPPQGRVYEAWVIRDGEPLRATTGDAGQGLIVHVLDVLVLPGDTAAVTVEQVGGAEKPTSAPFLIGKRGG